MKTKFLIGRQGFKIGMQFLSLAKSFKRNENKLYDYGVHFIVSRAEPDINSSKINITFYLPGYRIDKDKNCIIKAYKDKETQLMINEIHFGKLRECIMDNCHG